MKKLIYIFLALPLLLLTNCSSNKSKGEDAALKFCEAISSNSVSEIETKLQEIIKEYKEVETESEFSEAFYDNINCIDNKKITVIAKKDISGDYFWPFKVVEGKYKLKYDDGVFVLKFPIKQVEEVHEDFYFNVYDRVDNTKGELTLFDKDNTLISKFTIYRDNGSEQLFKGTNEVWLEINLFDGWVRKDGITEFIKSYINFLSAGSFQVFLEVIYKEEETDNYSDMNNNSGSDNNNESIDDSYNDNDSDFDALLNSYEEYIDQYLRLLKKAQNNDMTALSEYPSMLQKAEDLSRKIENARGNLSNSQLNRFMQLQQKIANAALDMYQQ